MKILGIGVDLVETKRIARLINEKNFINRIFSKKEIFNSKKKVIKKNILLIDLRQKNLFLNP